MRGQDNHRSREFRGGGPRGGVRLGPAFRGRGRATGRSRGIGYHTFDETTGTDSMFFDREYMSKKRPQGSSFTTHYPVTHSRGTPSPRDGGFGRRSLSGPGSNTPHWGRGWGAGYEFSPGRGPRRGNGRGGSELRPSAPLSGLLYEEIPYLRPVVFVRSVNTTAFQEEEEILQPVVRVGAPFLLHPYFTSTNCEE